MCLSEVERGSRGEYKKSLDEIMCINGSYEVARGKNGSE